MVVARLALAETERLVEVLLVIVPFVVKKLVLVPLVIPAFVTPRLVEVALVKDAFVEKNEVDVALVMIEEVANTFCAKRLRNLSDEEPRDPPRSDPGVMFPAT